MRLWLEHSRTVRLTPVEALDQPALWEDIRDFIEKYGADLFHTKMLMLGNVRAILHIGVDEFLDHLAEEQHPLQPFLLLEDLEAGRIDRDDAVRMLELVYEIVVDKLDRFIEYNTTTTQSDYGEKFYSLLDFLRVETAYERESWNLGPVRAAHELLSRSGRTAAALAWERTFREKTASHARRHIRNLRQLEKEYGMRLPSMSDHLEERFVKPLAVDRMLALIPRAMQDARRRPNRRSESFVALRREIERYLASTMGSAIEVPAWLRNLEHEVDKFESNSEEILDERQTEVVVPSILLGRRRLERELNGLSRLKPHSRTDESKS